MIIEQVLLVVKLVIGFSLIVTYLSLTGKTQLSNMTTIDYIGNFVIGAAIGGTIYSGSSLGDFASYILTLVITLLVVFSISYGVNRFSKAREVTLGVPLTLIQNGEFQYDTLKDNAAKIDIITVNNKLHLQGIMSMDELDYLQIQPSGDLVALKKGAQRPSVIVYNNDKYNHFSLASENLDGVQIDNMIKNNGIKNILFMEYYNGDLIVVTDKERFVCKV